MAKATHSDRLSAAQLQRLGLDKDPFAPTPPDGTPFSDSALETQVNVAVHILQHSDQPVLVHGEEGVGKTAFLTLVREAGAEALLVLDLGASARSEPAAVFRRIADAGGIDGDDASSAGSALLRLRDMGQRPVLVLDDAEEVPAPNLESLVSLRGALESRGATPGLILASSADLTPALSRLDVDTPLPEPHIVNLQPLDDSQTEAYIKSRLHAAGSLDGEQIAPSQCRQIHNRTHGNPENVNREAARLLSALAVTSGEAPGARTSRWLLPAGVGAVAVLILGLLIANLLGGGSGEPESQPAEVVNKPLTLPNRQTPESQRSAEPGQEPESATAAVGASPSGSPPNQAGAEQTTGSEPEPSATASAGGPEERRSRQPTANGSRQAGSQTEPAPESREQGSPNEQQAPETSAMAAAPNADSTATTAPESKEQGERAESSGDQAAAPPQATHTASHYTIQIVGAYDRSSLRKFVAKHGLGEQAEIMETRRKERPWYVVVYGDYADRAAAHDALDKLPEGMRRYGAWVRTFGSLSSGGS